MSSSSRKKITWEDMETANRPLEKVNFLHSGPAEPENASSTSSTSNNDEIPMDTRLFAQNAPLWESELFERLKFLRARVDSKNSVLQLSNELYMLAKWLAHQHSIDSYRYRAGPSLSRIVCFDKKISCFGLQEEGKCDILLVLRTLNNSRGFRRVLLRRGCKIKVGICVEQSKNEEQLIWAVVFGLYR